MLLTDKNLGPCAMNRDDCMQRCLKQHLFNTDNYERISAEVANACLRETIDEFLDFIKQPGMQIDEDDCICLEKTKDQFDRISTFYCLPKIHKKKKPIPLRPVVATMNAMLHALGKWVTKALNPLSTKVNTKLRDSDELIWHAKQLGTIKPNEYLFTTDAVAMHPNINAEEGIAAMLISFDACLLTKDINLPVKQLLLSLRLLMQCSVFRFGNSYFRQKKGAAIRSPPASDWAMQMLSFCKMSITEFLFEDCLRLNRRFMDDKTGL